MLSVKRVPISFPFVKASKSHDSNVSFMQFSPTTKENCQIGSMSIMSTRIRSSLHGAVEPDDNSVEFYQGRFMSNLRGKTIVVKYGGAVMESEALQESVISDIAMLSFMGYGIVLVHDGGPEINRCLDQLGLESKFMNGLRVTDASTMQIVSMVLGKVNKHVVASINKAGATVFDPSGTDKQLLTAVGLSGIDGRLLTVRPSPNSAQLGFVGDVVNVDTTVLKPLIDNYHIPVIASVAADPAAGEIAAALGAEKLILLTDVPGILVDRDDPGSLVKEIDMKGIKKMTEDGIIAGRMIPKVNCCVRALAQGVRTASIIDGRLKHSLFHNILTDQVGGIMIIG